LYELRTDDKVILKWFVKIRDCQSVNRMHLLGDQWRALVNTVMYFGFCDRYFLTSSATVNFSRRDQLFQRHNLANNTEEANSTMGMRNFIYEGVHLARWGRCF